MISKTLVYHRDISSFNFLKDCYESVTAHPPFINKHNKMSKSMIISDWSYKLIAV